MEIIPLENEPRVYRGCNVELFKLCGDATQYAFAYRVSSKYDNKPLFEAMVRDIPDPSHHVKNFVFREACRAIDIWLSSYEENMDKKFTAARYHVRAELMTYVDASTIHTTERDQELLNGGLGAASYTGRIEEGTCICRYITHDYGFFINVVEKKEFTLDDYENLKKHFSEQFVRLYCMAVEVGAAWINFDRDGKVYPDLLPEDVLREYEADL